MLALATMGYMSLDEDRSIIHTFDWAKDGMRWLAGRVIELTLLTICIAKFRSPLWGKLVIAGIISQFLTDAFQMPFVQLFHPNRSIYNYIPFMYWCEFLSLSLGISWIPGRGTGIKRSALIAEADGFPPGSDLRQMSPWLVAHLLPVTLNFIYGEILLTTTLTVCQCHINSLIRAIVTIQES